MKKQSTEVDSSRSPKAFFNGRRIIHKEISREGQEINTEYCVGGIDRLSKSIGHVSLNFYAIKFVRLYHSTPCHNSHTDRLLVISKTLIEPTKIKIR